jgi:hypothetical protein
MLFRRPDIARHVIRLVVRPDKGRKLYIRTEELLVSAAIRKVAVRLDAMSTFIWDGEEIPCCDDMWFALRMLWVFWVTYRRASIDSLRPNQLLAFALHWNNNWIQRAQYKQPCM